MKTGWQDIPEAEYQRGEKYKFCLRSSGIKALNDGVDEWWYKANNRSESDNNQHFYSAIHAYLTGQKHEIICLDFKDYRTNEAKEAKAKAVKNHPCQPVILSHRYADVESIAQTVASHPIAAGVLEHPDAVFEQAGIFEIQDGIYGMIKPDVRIPSERLMVDLKALGKSTESGFYMQARKLNYHYQDAWYRFGGVRIDREPYSFAFLGYETSDRFRCNLFYFPDFDPGSENYTRVWDRFQRNIDRFQVALKTNNWEQNYKPKPVRVPW